MNVLTITSLCIAFWAMLGMSSYAVGLAIEQDRARPQKVVLGAILGPLATLWVLYYFITKEIKVES